MEECEMQNGEIKLPNPTRIRRPAQAVCNPQQHQFERPPFFSTGTRQQLAFQNCK
jgi:hypothetical protein